MTRDIIECLKVFATLLLRPPWNKPSQIVRTETVRFGTMGLSHSLHMLYGKWYMYGEQSKCLLTWLALTCPDNSDAWWNLYGIRWIETTIDVELDSSRKRRPCGQCTLRILIYFLEENLRQRQWATQGIEGEVKTINPCWDRHVNLGKVQGVPLHGHVALEREKRNKEKKGRLGKGTCLYPPLSRGRCDWYCCACEWHRTQSAQRRNCTWSLRPSVCRSRSTRCTWTVDSQHCAGSTEDGRSCWWGGAWAGSPSGRAPLSCAWPPWGDSNRIW